jgi:hypothetical protein
MQNVNDRLAGYSGLESEMGSVAIKGGSSGREAEVDSQLRLSVITETPLQQALRKGLAYSWTNVPADIATTETMLIVRNNSSTQDLIIERISLSNGNAAVSNYDIHLVTAAYTNAGTAVVGVNLNSHYGNAAPVDATADETGNTQGSMILEYWAVLADATYELDMNVRLKNGTALGIDQVTESTRGTAQFVGYFVDVE